MEEGKASEKSLTSASAFVEGGIQEACDDACSICLEDFSDNDPSTVTSCKHEFHLQCILEWCQRSPQCPMCWQAISLKDPSSQELLDAVEHERNIRMNPPRNTTTTIFHHPTLGDFELQHLPVSASESELEEQIIQHLAAAAAMGRARQLARREGQRNRSSAQGRPHLLVFSTQPNGGASATSAASAASSEAPRDGAFSPPTVMIAGPNSPFITVTAEDSPQLIARPSSVQVQHEMSSSNSGQDRAGPSDLQSFSETLKSRFSALSMRYKESITKSTRGWKERLFARNNNNNSTPEPTPSARAQVRPEAEQQEDVATVSRMMDHLQIGEYGGTHTDISIQDSNEQQTTETGGSPSLDDRAATSASN